jgi:hypothetical protein
MAAHESAQLRRASRRQDHEVKVMRVNPRNLGARIERLRDMLSSSSDFGAPWRYFHDALVAQEGFGVLGEVGASKELCASIEAIAANLFGEAVPVAHLLAVCVREHGFRHGLSSVGGNPAMYFHYEATNQGLAGIERPGEDVLLVRFSWLELPAGTIMSTRRGAA